MSKQIETHNKLNDKSSIIRKIPVTVFKDKQKASRFIAEEIAELINLRQNAGQHVVLGLATGSTPVLVYRELIHLHRQSGLSFHNVITFNLDEYYPIQPDSSHSYYWFMHHHLFSHVDIPKENIHIPDGTITRDNIPEYCRWYENKIREKGGIDFQLLGIGRNGHIGFNEPGSELNSQTNLVKLDIITRQDAAIEFNGIENTPELAITMGIETILGARKIYLLAWGKGKRDILRKCFKQEVTKNIPATFLQLHPNATFIIDKNAAFNSSIHRFQSN